MFVSWQPEWECQQNMAASPREHSFDSYLLSVNGGTQVQYIQLITSINTSWWFLSLHSIFTKLNWVTLKSAAFYASVGSVECWEKSISFLFPSLIRILFLFLRILFFCPYKKISQYDVSVTWWALILERGKMAKQQELQKDKPWTNVGHLFSNSPGETQITSGQKQDSVNRGAWQVLLFLWLPQQQAALICTDQPWIWVYAIILIDIRPEPHVETRSYDVL